LGFRTFSIMKSLFPKFQESSRNPAHRKIHQ
jgi:hypothetical protein